MIDGFMTGGANAALQHAMVNQMNQQYGMQQQWQQNALQPQGLGMLGSIGFGSWQGGTTTAGTSPLLVDADPAPKSSNIEWLDRRVDEMRVKL